jgi:hypothetical protein
MLHSALVCTALYVQYESLLRTVQSVVNPAEAVQILPSAFVFHAVEFFSSLLRYYVSPALPLSID